MTEYKLRYKDKLTKQQAKDKICAHAIFGKHSIIPRPTSVKKVQEYFIQKRINTNILLQEFRDPKKLVPHFESLLRSTWKADVPNGSSVSIADEYGKEIYRGKGERGLLRVRLVASLYNHRVVF